jgi:hypothetical protein
MNLLMSENDIESNLPISFLSFMNLIKALLMSNALNLSLNDYFLRLAILNLNNLTNSIYVFV